MSKWHILAIIVLLGILGAVLWQSPPPLLRDLVDTITPEVQYPDAFLINSKTTQYNEHGALSHIIVSDRAHYFEPQTKTSASYTLLTEPRFTFYDETHNKKTSNNKTSSTNIEQQNVTWHASSTTAKSVNNGEEVLLNGNVSLIQQPSSNGEIPTTINSEELLIKPNLQYAETDKPVIIKNSSSVTTSTGLILSLDTNTVELLSNVRSRYEPR